MEDELFENLAIQYSPLIKNQIKKLHLTYDYTYFEQVALIALWEAALQYEQTKGSFSAFAYVKIRGKLIDEVRKEIRISKRLDYSEDIDSVSTGEFSQSNIQITDYLALLTNNQRKWVERSILQEQSIKEIALIEGVTIEAVKSWRKSALSKLRKIILVGEN